MKIFRDPVHNVIDLDTGNTEINDLIIDLIDSPDFQRLRWIKQLGFTYNAYPGASHTRFEHSLGVAFLARRFIDKILSMREWITGYYSDKPEITQRLDEFFDRIVMDKPLLIITALLHDVGHGPFSHVFESFTEMYHEKWTELIIKGNTEINRLLCAHDSTYPVKICDMLDKSNKDFPSAKILTGQLDVDRIDYILRDSTMTGAGYGNFDLEWMINVLSVGVGADGKIEIGFDLGKGLSAAEDFVMSRIYMYRNVYLHKTNKAAQGMLRLLLLRVRELLKKGDPIPVEESLKQVILADSDKMEQQLHSYVRLTDIEIVYHIKQWQNADDEIMRELSYGLVNRRLFKKLDARYWDEMKDFIDDVKGRGAYKDYSFALKTNTRKERLIYRPEDGPILLFDKNGGVHELTKKSKVIHSVLLEEDMPEDHYVHCDMYRQFFERLGGNS